MSLLSSESYLLDVNLNVLLQVVAIQVEDQVMDKVKTVTDDDERQLVSEFSFLSMTHIDKKETTFNMMKLGRTKDTSFNFNAIKMSSDSSLLPTLKFKLQFSNSRHI